MSAVRYLQMCFPGLLIRGHKVVTWDDLENTSLKCDVFKRYRSKPVVDEDIPSDFGEHCRLVYNEEINSTEHRDKRCYMILL